MNQGLKRLFQQKHKVIHIFGTPGTYKTAFIVQLILNLLEKGKNEIYLIDTSGNFPYIKLKSIEELLPNLIVFQPRTMIEAVTILDDMNIDGLDEEAILFIDQIFYRISSDDTTESHLASYLLAIISSISKQISFPIVVTNEGRGYDGKIHPMKEPLTLHYFDEHLHFEKKTKRNTLNINRFSDMKFDLFDIVEIDNQGLFSNLDLY
ncbi:MAG: hypothetical protein ACW97P_09100 [Candidatus Hodarchaeales archaeon]|jgi:hypothetical protein